MDRRVVRAHDVLLVVHIRYVIKGRSGATKLRRRPVRAVARLFSWRACFACSEPNRHRRDVLHSDRRVYQLRRKRILRSRWEKVDVDPAGSRRRRRRPVAGLEAERIAVVGRDGPVLDIRRLPFDCGWDTVVIGGRDVAGDGARSGGRGPTPLLRRGASEGRV